jgi:hypothetical protein
MNSVFVYIFICGYQVLDFSCLQGLPVSSESVVECLQRALLSVDADRSVNMRQLCDVLLRCAVAQSYPEQVLPPNRKPKVHFPVQRNQAVEVVISACIFNEV